MPNYWAVYVHRSIALSLDCICDVIGPGLTNVLTNEMATYKLALRQAVYKYDTVSRMVLTNTVKTRC